MPARSRHCSSECSANNVTGDGKASLGRRSSMMTWSQENCLIDDHRLTRERWGWGFQTRQIPGGRPGTHRTGCFIRRPFSRAGKRVVSVRRKVFSAAFSTAEEFCSYFIQFYRLRVRQGSGCPGLFLFARKHRISAMLTPLAAHPLPRNARGRIAGTSARRA